MQPNDAATPDQTEDRDARADHELAEARAGRLPVATLYSGTVESVDVPALCDRLGLSQSQFAAAFGFSVGAVRNWEQGRRLRDTSARILLNVIAHDPELVSAIAAGKPLPEEARTASAAG